MGKHQLLRSNVCRQGRGIQKNTKEVYYQSAVVKTRKGYKRVRKLSMFSLQALAELLAPADMKTVDYVCIGKWLGFVWTSWGVCPWEWTELLARPWVLMKKRADRNPLQKPCGASREEMCKDPIFSSVFIRQCHKNAWRQKRTEILRMQ